jgi:hypothetical protein
MERHRLPGTRHAVVGVAAVALTTVGGGALAELLTDLLNG